MKNLFVLKARLLAHIQGARWRGEADTARRFGDRVVMRGEHAEDQLVSDALFELVQEGKIEWFGAYERGDPPLRYRVPKRSDLRGNRV